MDPSSRPCADSRVEVERLEDELLLYDPDRGKVVNLNGTGAFVWSLSNGDHTLGEIVDEIERSAPDTDRDRIRSDTESFLQSMIDEGILELKDGSPDREEP